jgi:phage tail tape measure protein, TP901 family, core region
MSNSVTFTINFDGNAAVVSKELMKVTGQLQGDVIKLQGAFSKLGANMVVFNQSMQAVREMGSGLKDLSEVGLKLNSSMHDLSAITGVTGKGLKEIEGYARQTAKQFGGSAASAVESYKLILSQLSPEIAKVPQALSAMGNSIAVLSKTMGGDTVQATQVLTTAMNQFQVSTEDPISAAKEMSKMMNVMAAAAQAGSAELPQIAQALQNAGMAAKAAGVSFEETNAAIQVLDKAGKKGAEGGVALRNVLSTLAQGRFLPKDVKEELAATGVNIAILTDKTTTFAQRLEALKPIANDAALITKLFGKENSNAALALMSGIDKMKEWTIAVTGTTSAEEQAAIVMQSKEEQLARIRAKIDDFKIAIFGATGSFLPYIEALTQSLVPLGQMYPVLAALVSGIGMLNAKLIASTGAFGMFYKKIIMATVASSKFAVTLVGQGVKALAMYLASLVTTGNASTAFATKSVAAFGVVKTTAIVSCKAIGAAIKSIPIVGWVAAAIAAIASLFVFLRRKSKEAKVDVDEFSKAVASNAANSVRSINTLSDSYSKLGDNIEAKKKFIIDNTNKFRELGIAVNSVTDADNLFIKNKDKFIEACMLKSKVLASQELAAEKYKKVMEEQVKLDAIPKGDRYETITRYDSNNRAFTERRESRGYSKAKEKVATAQAEFDSLQQMSVSFTEQEQKLLIELGQSSQKVIETSKEQLEQQLVELQTKLDKAATDIEKNELVNKIDIIKGRIEAFGDTSVSVPEPVNSETPKYLSELEQKLQAVLEKNKLFGSEQQALVDQMRVVHDAINQLIDNGYNAESSAVQNLVNKLQGLRSKYRELSTIPPVNVPIKVDKIKPLTNPINKDIESKISAYKSAMDRLRTSINKTNKISSIFSDEQDTINNKIDATKEAIAELIDSGFSPSSDAVQKLISKYKKYVEEGDKIKLTQAMIGKNTEECISIMGENVSQIGQAFGGMAGGWLQFVGTILNTIPTLIAQFSAFIAACIAGNTAKQTSDAGTAITASVAASSGIPFPYNLVAMGVSVAATLAALATSVPAFADGGVVSGPTMALVGEYAGASNNPEVIAPLNKLKNLIEPRTAQEGTVTFRIEGRTLVGVLQKENNRSKRLR